MSNVLAFPKTALRPSLSANTLRALLDDTLDLLSTLNYADAASKSAADIQVECIRDQLTA